MSSPAHGALLPLLTPLGHLRLAPDAAAPPLPPELRERLDAAFSAGAGHGLLQLGATEVGSVLPKPGKTSAKVLDDAALADVFGIELAEDAPPAAPTKKKANARKPSAKTSAAKTRKATTAKAPTPRVAAKRTRDR